MRGLRAASLAAAGVSGAVTLTAALLPLRDRPFAAAERGRALHLQHRERLEETVGESFCFRGPQRIMMVRDVEDWRPG